MTVIRHYTCKNAGFALLVIGLYLLSDALSLQIRGIVPGAPLPTDPLTARVLYPNVLLTMLTKMGVSGLFFAFALSQPRLLGVVLPRIGLLIAFFVYALYSISWSETPSNSINDCLYLATALAAGVALTIRCSPKDATRAFAYAGAGIAITSLLMVIALPRYGVHGADEGNMANLSGAWRGVFIGKNTLGQIMAPFVVIFAANGNRLFGGRLPQIALTLISLLLVIASRSASAILLIVLSGAAYVVVFRLTTMMRTVVLILTPVVLLAASLMIEPILALLGRGSDMSGRSYIWAAAGRVLQERPWFGYGYGSATMGGLSRYIATRFQAPHVHNGYLDMALYGGLVGSLLFYGAVATALYRMVRLRDSGGDERLLAEVFGTFVFAWLVAAFSEVAFRPNIATGAYGFICLVMLAVPGAVTGHAARPGAGKDDADAVGSLA